MKVILRLWATVALALVPVDRAGSHSEVPLSMDRIIKEAQCIAVAEIVSVRETKTRCATGTEIRVRLMERLRGGCVKEEVLFLYSVHYWKKARFPWQEECPSVHYTVPPRVRNPRKGDRVIVTIRYFSDFKDYFVTSMSAMERLEDIREMMR